MRRIAAVVLAAGLLGSGPVFAADCNPRLGIKIFRAWEKKVPVADLPAGLPTAEALCIQQDMIRALSYLYGPVNGYKVALTSKAAQTALGVPHPVRGRITKFMLLLDGAVLPTRYGARPVWEADLLVRVKDDAINDARTPAEALVHLSHVWPALEFADLMLPPDQKPDAGLITAVNAGARWFITGRPHKITGTPDELAALGTFSVRVTGRDRKTVLAEGKADAIMGHPLNALLWLIEDLRKHGKALKKDDVVSLGSLTPFGKPTRGLRLRAVYEGFPGGTRTVHANFP